MWAGFALPFIVGCLNALHNYWNFVRSVNLQTGIPLFRTTTAQTITLSFPMLGFSYFVNLDIAFAIWFFNLLARVEQGLFGILGVTSTQKLYYAGGFPILAHQGMGAMLVLAALGLWTARPHLRAVWRKALTGDAAIDDSDEILSYRVAVCGLIGSVGFVAAWLWLAGLAWWILPVYLLAMYLIFIAITRVVAEGGIAAARAPLIAADFTTSALGTAAMGQHSLVALGFTFVWAADIRTFVMASAANGLKLAEEQLGRGKRGLFWAMALAITVSLIASIVTVLHLSYARWRHQSQRLVLRPYRRSGLSVQFHIRASQQSRGTQSGRLGLDAGRRRDNGAADAGPPTFLVVAAAPAGLCRQHHLDDQLHFLQCLFGLADQDRNPQIRRPAAVSACQTLFFRPDPGAVHRGRLVADYRLFYRHDRQ